MIYGVKLASRIQKFHDGLKTIEKIWIIIFFL